MRIFPPDGAFPATFPLVILVAKYSHFPGVKRGLIPDRRFASSRLPLPVGALKSESG